MDFIPLKKENKNPVIQKKSEALKPYQCSLWIRDSSYCVRGSFFSAG